MCDNAGDKRDRIPAAIFSIATVRIPTTQIGDSRTNIVCQYLTSLADIPASAPYHFVPEQALQIESDILIKDGPTALARFRATVLRTLSSGECRFKPRFVSTDEIEALIQRSYRRINVRCDAAADGHYVRYQDQYLKDLAICRRAMFPAGARLVQPDAGFQRDIVVRGGPWQALRFLALLALLRSNRPVFQIHVHPDELDDFDETGWRRTLGCIARALAVNRNARAVYGCSWFYDPAIARISPKLGYVNSIAAEAGGRFFEVGIDDSGDAFARSPTRRELAAAGTYVPRSWAVIWPRNDLVSRASSW